MRARRRSRSALVGAAFAGALAIAGSAAGQPAGAVDERAGDSAAAQPPGYDTLVMMLESSIAEERETALRSLASDPAFSLNKLETTLRTQELSSEQRFRLREAAKQRYMGSTRAAMGVQFSRLIPLAERVIIEKTYPEFPSFKVLKEGDMVIAVEGEQLRSRDAWTRLGAHIVSHDPGETLSIVVRRGAERLELNVQLGNYGDLPGQVPMDLTKLERGWQLRSASYLTTGKTEPIAFDLPAGKWDAGMDQGDDIKRVRIKMQLTTGHPYRPRIVAGGEARGGEIDADEIWNSFNNNRAPALNQRALRNQPQMLMQQDVFSSMRTMTIQQEIAELERYQEQLKSQVGRTGLAGEKPPGQGLADWERTNLSQQKLLQMTEQSLIALKTEAGEVKEPEKPALGPMQP